MKTQNQKQNDKFSKRVAHWRAIFSQRISQWWDNVVVGAVDIDFGEIFMNIFLILLIAGAFFGFAYLAVNHPRKDKTTDSIMDSVAVVEAPRCTKKSCRVDWDFDTITVLTPNEKGYKLHFKGKIPYFLTIENLDTVQ